MTEELKGIMAIISGIICTSGFGAIASAFISKRKNKAETSEITVKTAIELNKIMMENHKGANQELAYAKRNAADWEQYAQMLKHELKRHGIDVPEMKGEKG